MDVFQARLSQPLLQRIIPLLPQDTPIHLVGGAVRDAFLNLPSYDLDFITSGDALKIARKLANVLGAAYFPLDQVRKVARLVIKPDPSAKEQPSGPVRVDISAYQGVDLLADLHGRDFTINAIAVDIHQLQTLVDPTGGAADLLARRLRPCSPTAFLDDPVRILRAVRFSVALNLMIMPETLQYMREATGYLSQVSPERIRDELFRILATRQVSSSFRILDAVGALDLILPEVSMLKGVRQTSPHVMDAWDHTLTILSRLESVLNVLSTGINPDKVDNLIMGLAVLYLGQYRPQVSDHLAGALNIDRPHRGLLFLAALYHDVGKQLTQSTDEDGKIRFIGHDQVGGVMVGERAQALKLSNSEINRLKTIVNQHMRPSLLSHSGDSLSRKAIYHFFKDTGAAGVDICILSLADMLATYGPTLTQDRWVKHLKVIQALFAAWWEQKAERVLPELLINGDELMQALKITPGPQVGYLLEAIREAQINHEIRDKRDAIRLAQKLLPEVINKKTG